MAEPLSAGEVLWQKRNRLRRILKRRKNYVLNTFQGKGKKPEMMARAKLPSEKLQAGDFVRVRSKEEIESTLDKWNQLKRCSFMEEMWPYCGTEQRVVKRVQKFLDERDYLLKKCNGIVILENVFCEGTKDFGGCDRTCFFFWREEWLEKLESGNSRN
jgi:hypothetical protein